MESRAKIFGHPAHQIVVMFPIGMLAFVGICDAARAVTGRRWWGRAAKAALGAGLVGTAVAAPLGFLDYRAIPEGTRAKSVGRLHGVGNLGVVSLFLGSHLARRAGASRAGVTLSTAGLLLAGVTAWLGTELVNRLGIGVYSPTSFDAPSSAATRTFGISLQP